MFKAMAKVMIEAVPAAVLAAALLFAGCAQPWRQKLAKELPVMGHRNWIIVADSAYPSQSGKGIETVYTGAGQLEAVEAVLKAIDATGHIRAKIYVDGEMKYISEKDAPGIEAYRKELFKLLGDRPVNVVMHEEVFPKLEEAAKLFNVLILKTDMTLPYTSVFVELDCGYWSSDAEKRLRDAIGKAKK